MAWTFVIIGAIVSYADIVLSTLRVFGILGPAAAYNDIPLVRIAFANIPLLFSGIGFLVAVNRRRLP
jgi:hypothetical protein